MCLFSNYEVPVTASSSVNISAAIFITHYDISGQPSAYGDGRDVAIERNAETDRRIETRKGRDMREADVLRRRGGRLAIQIISLWFYCLLHTTERWHQPKLSTHLTTVGLKRMIHHKSHVLLCAMGRQLSLDLTGLNDDFFPTYLYVTKLLCPWFNTQF